MFFTVHENGVIENGPAADPITNGYHIEKIVGRKVLTSYDQSAWFQRRMVHYKVKWVGYEQETYQPYVDMNGCVGSVNEFLNQAYGLYPGANESLFDQFRNEPFDPFVHALWVGIGGTKSMTNPFPTRQNTKPYGVYSRTTKVLEKGCLYSCFPERQRPAIRPKKKVFKRGVSWEPFCLPKYSNSNELARHVIYVHNITPLEIDKKVFQYLLDKTERNFEMGVTSRGWLYHSRKW